MNQIYRPTKPGEITRCDDCINDDKNCYECMIDDLLDNGKATYIGDNLLIKKKALKTARSGET